MMESRGARDDFSQEFPNSVLSDVILVHFISPHDAVEDEDVKR